MAFDIQEIVDNNFNAHPDEAAQATKKTYLRSWFLKRILNGGGPKAHAMRPTVEAHVENRFKALEAVDTLIEQNNDKFEQAKGNESLRGWFVGQAMKALQGLVPLHDIEQAVKLKFAV